MHIPFQSVRRLAAAVAILLTGAVACQADDAPASGAAKTSTANLIVPENPREGGARYGQAAGVALVCYGMRVTDLPEVLKSKYQGQALADFNDQAGRILEMWKDTLSCKHAGGPNQCRLSQAFSCAEAMKEIGPIGSKLPGMVDAKPERAETVAAPDAAAVPKP